MNNLVLLDTNIVLRFKNANSPSFAEVSGKLQDLVQQGFKLIISPQVLYEFYTVATRPLEQNGFGLDCGASLQEVETLCQVFNLLPDNEKILPCWLHLIKKYDVKGKKSHDTRLVAFMLSHQISNLYTLNTQDFTRFQEEVTLV